MINISYCQIIGCFGMQYRCISSPVLLQSPHGESKYKQQAKMYSDIPYQNVSLAYLLHTCFNDYVFIKKKKKMTLIFGN